MKTLIEYLVKNVVNNPDDVNVEENFTKDESGRTSYIYNVRVNPEDMGLIIGKNGQTIKSVRSIAKIKAIKEGIYVDIKVEE